MNNRIFEKINIVSQYANCPTESESMYQSLIAAQWRSFCSTIGSTQVKQSVRSAIFDAQCKSFFDAQYIIIFVARASPSSEPLSEPSSLSSSTPSASPSMEPSTSPSGQPSAQPYTQPSASPSARPSSEPSSKPSQVLLQCLAHYHHLSPVQVLLPNLYRSLAGILLQCQVQFHQRSHHYHPVHLPQLSHYMCPVRVLLRCLAWHHRRCPLQVLLPDLRRSPAGSPLLSQTFFNTIQCTKCKTKFQYLFIYKPTA